MQEIKVAIIGLDTSHSVEFTRRMQAPDCHEEAKVFGLRAVTCMKFRTPFTNDDVLTQRQQQLELWGVQVTDDFEEAISNCDAIMLEINDPNYHLEYVKKCVGLNKPIFLDKPMADTYENAKIMYDLIKNNSLKIMSSSSLRFSSALVEACEDVGNPIQMYCYGPLGIPPVGSGIVWYGVHCFEMLQRAMGQGALKVDTRRDPVGTVVIVEYPENRRGIVELTTGAYVYGGTIRTTNKNRSYIVDGSSIYSEQLRQIKKFFDSGETPVKVEDTLEVMNLLDCAARSYESNKSVELNINR